MSNEKPSLAEYLHERRKLVLIILGMPVFGMAVASLLILYLRPDNTIIVLGVIIFLAVQYLLTMFLWTKKVEQVANLNKNKVDLDKNELPSLDVETKEVTVLMPEEKRILPIEE